MKLCGFNLSRKNWTTLNRLRCNVGKCGHWLFKWGISDSKSCDCGEDDQTLVHIATSCPLRRFIGDYFELLEGKSTRAFDWIKNIDINI